MKPHRILTPLFLITGIVLLLPDAGAQVVIPAGTTFRVRTGELIDVDSTRAGARFRGALDDLIMMGGFVVVSRGADVVLVASKVEQGGKFKAAI